jgi:uncharacterized DUF497 family protein
MKLTVRRLHWERENEARVAGHRITPAEVDALCRGEPLALRSAAERLILIGATQAGRDLTAVLAPLGPDVYTVVTARPATRRERRHLHDRPDAPNGDPPTVATPVARARRLPFSPSHAEEASWWDAHDAADYLDELVPVDLRFAGPLGPPRVGVDELLSGRTGKGTPGAVRHWLHDRLERLRELERRRKS